MEQSKALQALMEAGDLVKMLEEITSPAVLSSITAASMAGVRVTLKNVRESILASHDVLASQVIQRAKVQLESNPRTSVHSLKEDVPLTRRRDLRDSIEKIVE
ncbi:MAG: hypothetical protein GX589_07990 [Deltaproteobacteria bacterium]|nr:hypothetical protein [Deltaproteobacteria bacterium]